MRASFFKTPAWILSKVASMLMPPGAQLFRYVVLLCIPTLAAIYFFLSQSPLQDDLRGWLYWLSLPAYYIFILLLFSLLYWPLALLTQTRWLIPVLGMV